MKVSGAYIWTDETAREAKRDYCEAFWLVHRNNKPGTTMEEFCQACGGHNLSYEMFDMNYKHVCVTIHRHRNGNLRVYKNFDYWPDPESMVHVDCNIEEFLDY